MPVSRVPRPCRPRRAAARGALPASLRRCWWSACPVPVLAWKTYLQMPLQLASVIYNCRRTVGPGRPIGEGSADSAVQAAEGPAAEGVGHRERQQADRKSVVEGKSVSVRVDLGGRRTLKKRKRRRRVRNTT